MRTWLIAGVLFVATACGGKHRHTTTVPGAGDGTSDGSSSSTKGQTKPNDATVSTSTGDDMRWLGPVYFEFDSSDLTPTTRDTLAKLETWLEGHPAAKITIEGHCDEQGTTEYNIALGERRAVAIVGYLEHLGAPAAKLGRISYGAEHPADDGHDETAWAKNRRGEFKIQR